MDDELKARLAALPDAHEMVRRFNQRARRSLGQHFLLDGHALDAIAYHAGAQPGATVYEIGPGPGTLTVALLRRGARVVAVEKDRRAVEFLSAELGGLASFELHEGDALTHRLPDDARDWVATGNLPYNISTQIYFHLLDQRPQLSRMVFMFQREVAKRFVAEPRTKAYGILSLMGGFYHAPRLLMTLPPGAFRPAPKVHSAVVVFERRDALPLEGALEGAFRETVRAAFAHRRKTLPNSAQGLFGLARDAIAEALEGLGLSARARAEELDLDTFCALTRALVARADRSGS